MPEKEPNFRPPEAELEEIPEHAMQPLDENEPYFGALEMVDEDESDALLDRMNKLEQEVKPALVKWRKEVTEALEGLDIDIIPSDPRDSFSEALEQPKTKLQQSIFDKLRNSSLRREAANLLDQLEETTAEFKRQGEQKKAA